MTDDDETRRVIRDLSMEKVQALQLARAGHEFYAEIVSAISDTVRPDGSSDIEAFTRRLNEALTRFAPRDHEIQRLLAAQG